MSLVELQLVSVATAITASLAIYLLLCVANMQVVEEIDERFSDEQTEKILKIVSSELPSSAPDENTVDSDH